MQGMRGDKYTHTHTHSQKQNTRTPSQAQLTCLPSCTVRSLMCTIMHIHIVVLPLSFIHMYTEADPLTHVWMTHSYPHISVLTHFHQHAMHIRMHITHHELGNLFAHFTDDLWCCGLGISATLILWSKQLRVRGSDPLQARYHIRGSRASPLIAHTWPMPFYPLPNHAHHKSHVQITGTFLGKMKTKLPLGKEMLPCGVHMFVSMCRLHLTSKSLCSKKSKLSRLRGWVELWGCPEPIAFPEESKWSPWGSHDPLRFCPLNFTIYFLWGNWVDNISTNWETVTSWSSGC